MDEAKQRERASKRALARKLKRAEAEARKRAIKERPPFKGLQIRPTASLFDDAGKQEPGENNWAGFGFDIHPQVTLASSALLIVFIALTVMFPTGAERMFENIMDVLTKNIGWFFILSANLLIIAAIYFALGKFGSIRIGGNDAQP